MVNILNLSSYKRENIIMPIEKLPPEKNQAIKEMATAIETTTNPKLKEIFSRIMVRMENSDIVKEAEEFKKEILKKPDRPEQQILSIIPHQMAKTSIFFPMSDKELKEENRRINKIEHETGWGKIVIEGVKLAIFEEDIFLGLLYLAKNSYKRSQDGFVLEININEIIHLIYGRRGYSRKSEDVILRTLKNFELISFDLIIGEWEKKGKEQLKVEKIKSIGGIIQSYTYDKNTKNLSIRFNVDFFAFFLESMLTDINLTLRRKLKKDGSKALLRFLSTHTQPGQMHILTVLNAINFNTNQPLYRLRSRLKEFIGELKRNNVLGPKTKLYNEDVVFFDILPLKKQYLTSKNIPHG